jgi:hypothetical protein
MEATMRKFFLIAVIFLSAATAHAGPDLTVAGVEAQQTSPSSSQLPDANVLDAKRQAISQRKMTMQKAMRREMQLHPIRTRFHFALLKLKQKLRRVY